MTVIANHINKSNVIVLFEPESVNSTLQFLLNSRGEISLNLNFNILWVSVKKNQVANLYSNLNKGSPFLMTRHVKN